MGRQITMENVTINGDFVIKYDFLNLYKSYTPTFLGGGTISKLRTESENPANFGNSLAPGCYFVGSDGRRVQGNALERSTKLENVTVMTCEHETDLSGILTPSLPDISVQSAAMPAHMIPAVQMTGNVRSVI
mgnify:CR=1 FL=1